MTIANGDVVEVADVSALYTAALALLQADNADVPLGFDVRFSFPNLVTSTEAYKRKVVFVCPCDLLLEAVAVEGADHTAASTLTVRVRGDGALFSDDTPEDGDDGWGANVVGAVGAGITKLARLLFDNTLTYVGADFEGTARAFRVLPKGSTITITVESTSVATPSETDVTLVCREFWVREARA